MAENRIRKDYSKRIHAHTGTCTHKHIYYTPIYYQLQKTINREDNKQRLAAEEHSSAKRKTRQVCCHVPGGYLEDNSEWVQILFLTFGEEGKGPSIQRGWRQKKAQESTVKRSATRNLEATGIRSKQKLREGVCKVNSGSHFVCTSCQDGRERQSTRFHTETGNFHPCTNNQNASGATGKRHHPIFVVGLSRVNVILFIWKLLQRLISRWALSASHWQLHSVILCFRADPLSSSRMRVWMSDCM